MFAQIEDSSSSYFYAQITQYPIIENPYRAESYGIGYLKKGRIKMHTGLVERTVIAPSLIAIGPTVILSFSNNDEVMEMDIIFFKSDFFLENQAQVFFLMQFEFFDNNEMHVFRLAKETENTSNGIFNLIKNVTERSNKHERSIIRSYLYILIYEIDALKPLAVIESDISPLFAKFTWY